MEGQTTIPVLAIGQTRIVCVDPKCGTVQTNTPDFCWKCKGSTKWIAVSAEQGANTG